mmetsp:Transcript_89203/g.260802  ORF Transcript_89203/g.260802 Transcript_89203/m.260802 type:complete len:257 (+) Transcript_89203:167-937(+)
MLQIQPQSIVTNSPVHVDLADRAVGAPAEPLIHTSGMEDVAAREPATSLCSFKVAEAHHALVLLGASCTGWRPCEPLDLGERLFEEAPPAGLHVLDLALTRFGDRRRRKNRGPVHCNWLRQGCPWWVDSTLAKNRRALANACTHIRLARLHLKLHSVVREELATRKLAVSLCLKVRLKIVHEDLKLVRSRERIQERCDVNLLKLRRRIPLCTDLRPLRHYAEAGRFGALDLQLYTAYLENLAREEQAHSLWPSSPT